MGGAGRDRAAAERGYGGRPRGSLTFWAGSSCVLPLVPSPSSGSTLLRTMRREQEIGVTCFIVTFALLQCSG